MNKIDQFNKTNVKEEIPQISSGDTIKVFQRIKEKNKERLQAFEGIVIAIKHGRGISATFTVRRKTGDIGVEKIFPFHSPLVEKIEIIKKGKPKKAKLYYLREKKGEIKIK
ncbi:MAG: 50S ribosomal protein L19 [Candidatus Pacebacteria bacterium]|nr:50S ribosomal protein L19 [Candidatus Paceibacterota bacterium]